MTLKLSLLGPLRITFGEESRLLSGNGAALLGFLALHHAAGHAVSRARLAGTLWPDSPEERARHLLSNALYRLRRTLGPAVDFLTADNDFVALTDCDVDLVTFDRGLAASDPATWSAALALYHGDLLEEQDAPWLHAPRAAYRERYLRGLARAVAALAARDPDRALPLALRWARSDPLEEKAHLAVMRLFAAGGRLGAALRQYEELVQLLADELDIPPSAEAQALARQLRREHEEQTAPGAAVATPFVGRRRERSRLVGALDGLREGRGALVFVEGAPGIGKSRLLAEAAAAAEWRDVAVAWGRAVEFDGRPLYSPLGEALQAATAGPRLDRVRQRLTPILHRLLVPLLPRLAGESSSTGAAPLPRPTTLATAVTRLAAVLTDERPLCLLLDDVQWADPQFWPLLTALAATTADRSLLIVLSYRDRAVRDDETAWTAMAALDREHAPMRLRLAGLSPADVSELCRALGHALSETDVAAIHRLGNGNPLVTDELLRHDRLASPTFERLLNGRLSRLPGEARAALAAAAVIGRDFEHERWRAVYGAEPPVGRLLAERLLAETDGGYTFTHDLVRAHLVDALATDERRRWHARVAAALRGTRPDAATLAWHLEQAGAVGEALHYYRRAAEYALHCDAFDAARAHTERALALAGTMDASERLPLEALRLRLGQVETWSSADAATAERLIEEARATGDEESHLKLQLITLDHLAARGEVDKLLAGCDEVLALAAESAAPLRRIEALILVARLIINVIGDSDRAGELAQQAADLAERSRVDPVWAATALMLVVQAQLYRSEIDAAPATLARVEGLLAGHPARATLEPDLLWHRAVVAQRSGRWEEARDCQRQLIDIHRRSGNARGLIAALYNSANINSFMGQHEEAILYGEELLQFTLEQGSDDDRHLERVARIRLANCYMLAGRLEEAEAQMEAVMPWLLAEEASRASINGWTTLGGLRYYQGEFDTAHHAYGRALVLTENKNTTSALPFICRAETAQLLGRTEEAAALLAEARGRLNLAERSTNSTFYYYVRYLHSGDEADLAGARSLLHEQARRIRDEGLRADYLARLPLHRDIETAWQALQPARAKVRLVRADVPLGRPLHDEDYVDVDWTVDAGEADETIRRHHGKVALRRHRLCRLVAEARAQGAAPTQADLAAALGVSVRTVERDGRALAEEGRPLGTRRMGSK